MSADSGDSATSADGDATPFRDLHFIVLDHEDAWLRPSWASWDGDGDTSASSEGTVSPVSSGGEEKADEEEEECVLISDVAMLDAHIKV